MGCGLLKWHRCRMSVSGRPGELLAHPAPFSLGSGKAAPKVVRRCYVLLDPEPDASQHHRATPNPHTRNFKGYLLWGWLVLLAVVIVFALAAFNNQIKSRCTPQGDCMDEF